MKKYMFILLSFAVFSVTTFAQSKQAASTLATSLPKELLGHWQKGSFSLTSFEEYDGKYVGPANETSVSYVIEGNGVAREYFISNTNSYNCRMQILGYREGKIVLNAADNSFEFQPTSGYYSSLTCMSKSTTKKAYGSKDLYPNYGVKFFLETDENGAPALLSKTNNSGNGLRLKKIR